MGNINNLIRGRITCESYLGPILVVSEEVEICSQVIVAELAGIAVSIEVDRLEQFNGFVDSVLRARHAFEIKVIRMAFVGECLRITRDAVPNVMPVGGYKISFVASASLPPNVRIKPSLQ